MKALIGSRVIDLFLNVDTRCGWVVNAMPHLLYPQERQPVPTVQEAGWASGPLWMGRENFTPTGVRTPNIGKMRVNTFIRKTNPLQYTYTNTDFCIIQTEAIKAFGLIIDLKLHRLQHVHYIYSQSIKLIVISQTITISFSTLDYLLLLYFNLIRPKPENASVAWNSITSTDTEKLACIQQKYVSLCQNCSFFHNNFIMMAHFTI
jgi:hypothetical protein